MENRRVTISPEVSYIALGRNITLRLDSNPEIQFEKRWNKIDEEGNIYELDGHNEEFLNLGPISEFHYGTYFCEVRQFVEDDFFKSEYAKVLVPESKPRSLEKSSQKYGVSLEISTRNSRLASTTSSCNSPGVSPKHPYYKGFVNKPRLNIFNLTTERSVSQLDRRSTPEVEPIAEFIDSDDSSSSFLQQEDNFSLTELPKIRPNRIFSRDSNLSSESDLFHDISLLTSTPLGCPETPEWSLASSGYAIASPSFVCSVSSSLPSPVSQLRNTFYEMAALPRRSSLSRLSCRSEHVSRPQFKNEQDFRLAGYQQGAQQPSSVETKLVKSHFRFSLQSTSKFESNK